MRVPLDLKSHFQLRSEIKKTLRTTCYESAKSLVKKTMAEFERLFTMIRSGVLTADLIKQLVNDYIDKNVKVFEMIRNRVPFENPSTQEFVNKRNIFFDDILQNKQKRKIYSGLFTADELFHKHVKSRVAGRSEQVPEYNQLRNSGDEGGDFVFIKR